MARRRKLPKNVTAFVDRHGKERFRFRQTGRPTYYFQAAYGTAEFDAEVTACRAADPVSAGTERTIPGSVSDLIVRWYRSADYAGAGEKTQHVTRLIVEHLRAEFGNDRVDGFTFEHIEAILLRTVKKRRDAKGRMVGGPEAASRLRKHLNRLFNHGIRVGMITTNPVTIAAPLKKPRSTGFHTWSDDEIAQFQARHPLGSKPRLALEIMLWTAQRGGDTRLFGAKQIRGGRISYKQGKTGKDLWLPIAPQLAAAIRAMPALGIEAYLVAEHGRPFSPKGFGNWFREQCDAAELPHCTAHGLRKAAARRAAQLGAGNAGLKAVGGWSNDREVATYTAGVDQAALAADTLGRVIAWDLARDNG
jgi:integrase